MEMKNNTWKSYDHIFFVFLSFCCLTSCQKKKTHLETTLPRKNYDVIKMANGAMVNARVTSHQEETKDALTTATMPDAYTLGLTLDIALPSPATTMQELCAATPELERALPSLKDMLPKASKSGERNQSLFYTKLFENKKKMLQHQLAQLGQLPSRESLFDCQTILLLTHHATQSRALLVQAIMNVNADGSDGDRNIPLEKLSSTYQAQTNYRWPKITTRPNPNIAELEEQVTRVENSLKDENLKAEQKITFHQQLLSLENTLSELKRWSFLIGSADPFIVLPKFMLEKNHDGASLGDYAVILYQGTLYPAIVGDIGPASKIGEASLRICRAIDPQSSATHRPFNTPHVSYFIFLGSAEFPFHQPDYAHWSERCHELWKNLGGSDQLAWHEWEQSDQPWPQTNSEKIESPSLPPAEIS